MALRVLSDEERQSLQGNSHFLEKCQWAIRNYADYWSTHNGASLSDSDRLKWAKDRFIAVDIVLNDINDPSVALKFVKASKGTQFDLGVAPVSDETIIAAFVAGNRFDEFAGSYFSLKAESVNFSTTGN